MASLQSNSTCSFKHHLIMTGEAWPASRAILAWYLYIVRTSTIAKNRHLNIVLQAELFLRTGTYDRPKNTVPVGTCTGYGDTFGPALAQKNTKPWRSTPIHVSPATTTIYADGYG